MVSFLVSKVGPVPNNVHDSYSYTTSSIVLSQRPSRNEGIVVASLPNNSEEPLPVDPQSAPVIIQVSVSHCVFTYLISGIFSGDLKFDCLANFLQLPTANTIFKKALGCGSILSNSWQTSQFVLSVKLSNLISAKCTIPTV